jgi:hypothetical protein
MSADRWADLTSMDADQAVEFGASQGSQPGEPADLALEAVD